jgi:hypothetical protein
VIAIATINVWNRLNATTRQVTGEWIESWINVGGPESRAA